LVDLKGKVELVMGRIASSVLTAVLLGAAAALLWLVYGYADSYRLFDWAAFPKVLHFAATASSAALAVFVFGQVLLRFGLARALDAEPNDLQRTLVFALLTFIASALALAHLGFDPTAIVTTSAIVTAVIGLSVQPLLTGLMTGMTLNRVVRIGDAVVLDGQPTEIRAVSWRALTGRRSDGSSVIIPNGQLANSALTVLSADQPCRLRFSIEAPPNIQPDRFHEMIAITSSDLLDVDAISPIEVWPKGSGSSATSSTYDVSLWVKHFSRREQVEGKIRRRLWYAFRREKSGQSNADIKDPSPTLIASVAAALETAARADPRLLPLVSHVDRALAKSEFIQFGHGESIILPPRLAGHASVLVEGKVCDALESQPSLSREAWLEKIAKTLARYIGPFAGYAVRAAAAARDADIMRICHAVANEIDDPKRRSRFLGEIDPPVQVPQGAGFLLRPEDSVYAPGRMSVRAVESATFLALAPEVLESDSKRRSRS
jgi:small-conductance mechanosensitive channel